MLYVTPDCFSSVAFSLRDTRAFLRVFRGLKEVLTPAEVKALFSFSDRFCTQGRVVNICFPVLT